MSTTPTPARSTSTLDQAQLLDAVRRELARLAPDLAERRMFGGTTVMWRGNMLCCVSRQGLMVRVGADAEATALARPAAQPCMGAGRRMAGFVMVAPEGLFTLRDLASWLQLAIAYVMTLPVKPATEPARKNGK